MQLCSCHNPDITQHRSGVPYCRRCGCWHKPGNGRQQDPAVVEREIQQLQPQIRALAARPFTWLGFKFNTPAPAAR